MKPAKAPGSDVGEPKPSSVVSKSPFEQIKQMLSFVRDEADPEFRSEVFQRCLPILATMRPSDRDLVAPQIKEKLGVTKGALRKELEGYRPAPSEVPDDPEVTKPSAESLALLRDPKLIEQFLQDTVTLGVVGERFSKTSLFLAMTSRICEAPMDVIVKGESSAGKNHVVEGVARLFPPEDVVRASNLSPQALSYWSGNLKHKIFFLIP